MFEMLVIVAVAALGLAAVALAYRLFASGVQRLWRAVLRPFGVTVDVDHPWRRKQAGRQQRRLQADMEESMRMATWEGHPDTRAPKSPLQRIFDEPVDRR